MLGGVISWWRVLLLLVLSGCGAGGMSVRERGRPESMSFIEVRDGRFYDGDEVYAFVGVNFWYGMNLASQGPGGDRARLDRELDSLESLGVQNLRILGSTEGPASEPWRVTPPLQVAPGEYDEAVLDGLDYLISAAGRRGLRVVVCLNNYWFWSGGMAAYLAWHGEGPVPYPLAPGGSWHDFQHFASRFYSHAGARADFERHVAFLLDRVNPHTGLRYREDPTIMAWELANEPRGMDNAEAMVRWIHRTAAFIKSIDVEHLVTTGSEGDTPVPIYHGVDFVRDHQSPHIDYATIHLWPQNWGWFDPADAERTYEHAEARAVDYVTSHIDRARELGKPVVLEEFGLARDGGSHAPESTTVFRDRFFEAMLEEVRASAAGGGPALGANPWAWGGEGRPRRPPGGSWQPGDPWLGDPPHEPQGWYSLYDGDSTLVVIGRFARAIASAGRHDGTR